MNRLTAFLSRRENWPIIIVPLLLLAWARYGAESLARKTFESGSLYAGPYREPLPAGEAGEPLAESVLLIVVDGLRLDTSRRLPVLERIRGDGAERVMLAGEPSLSLPGWTAIATGAWQEQSGFTSNFVDRAVEIDSIFLAARRAGLSTSIGGPEGYDQLFSEHADRIVAFEELDDPFTDLEGVTQQDQRILESALEAQERAARLQLVHFISPDNAGHGFGGSSAEYEQAAQAVDQHIGRLLENVDLENTAVLVTSDHGHLDSGGHSGGEPEVIQVPFISAGAGILPGRYDTATHTQVAPTIAALLGTSFPSHSQGFALFDQIDATIEQVTVRALSNAEQVSARTASMLDVIGAVSGVDRQSLQDAQAALDAGDFEVAFSRASDQARAADEAWEQARGARLLRERVLRVPIALITLVPAVLYLLWWRRAGWNWHVPALAALAYFALWNINFHGVQGLTYSLSWFKTEETISTFIEARVTESLIAIVVITLGIGIVRRGSLSTEVARDVVHSMLAIGLVGMLQILVFYVLWDIEFDWYLPDFTLAFKYYMDVFQTAVYWPLTPLPLALVLPVVAVGVAWLASLGRRRTVS